MNNVLNYNACMAWIAFGLRNYSDLEKYSDKIYNHFVHNPSEILKLDSPLLIGKIFQICLGFQEPDEDIQEVRAENAFLCFSQALKSDKPNIRDEASARLMMLLIRDQKHLIKQVEVACQSAGYNPYDIVNMLSNRLPNDMPMATNTKMLLASYYLYDCIIDKTGVCNEFVSPIERNAFESVKSHTLDNCSKLTNQASSRKIELGGIVFEKIRKKLQRDIESYSAML